MLGRPGGPAIGWQQGSQEIMRAAGSRVKVHVLKHQSLSKSQPEPMGKTAIFRTAWESVATRMADKKIQTFTLPAGKAISTLLVPPGNHPFTPGRKSNDSSMKSYQPADIRNFRDRRSLRTSGKTMLAEAMLMCRWRHPPHGRHRAGIERFSGIIIVGEQQRQNLDPRNALSLEWQGRRLNALDTPGYLDFSSEALNASVWSTSRLVCDQRRARDRGWHGDDVGIYATQFGDSQRSLSSMRSTRRMSTSTSCSRRIRERFGTQVFPMQVAGEPGPRDSTKVLDVLRSEICTYAATARAKYEESPVTGEMKTRVEAMHKELIEHIAESDDTLAGKKGTFAEGSLSED